MEENPEVIVVLKKIVKKLISKPGILINPDYIQVLTKLIVFVCGQDWELVFPRK
jgi:hypothetical protein